MARQRVSRKRRARPSRRTLMRLGRLALLVAVGSIALAAAPSNPTAEPTLQPLPAELETRLALSAAPAGVRDRATVYLLDPKVGYRLTRPGTNGVTCIVERTQWELADFRDDLYIP